MKTRAHGRPDTGITLPLTLPAGTLNGVPTTYGTDGLLIVPVTDRVTADDLSNPAKATPQGLKAGQASAFLPGVSVTLRLPLDAAIPEGGRVYKQPDGTFTASANDAAVHVGWKVGGLLAVRANS